MENIFVGRVKEKEVLQKALVSNESEMISVIGRRRVGKTFLVKTVYKKNIDCVVCEFINFGMRRRSVG